MSKAGILFGLLMVSVIAFGADQVDELRIPLSDCPVAVQKTFRQEAFGAKIETVEKESVYGRIIYEADAKIDGKKYEIKVAAEGALISKKLCLK